MCIYIYYIALFEVPVRDCTKKQPKDNDDDDDNTTTTMNEGTEQTNEYKQCEDRCDRQ